LQIHTIDIVIILTYLICVVSIGFLVSSRAGQNMNAYFLGGKKLPWYMLGIANASSMFDITGTMWLVYILFVYGLKGCWMPWLWPTFNQIFLMIYLAVWIRRSNVLTGAEWISTRFGKGKSGELSRISVVIFAIVSVIGFLTYAFQGIGKFASVFFPWNITSNGYAIIFMTITTIYVIIGGMYSVVLTDLLQFAILGIASIFIGIIAMNQVSPEMLSAVIPSGWKELFFGWKLNLDWSGVLDFVNNQIAADGYSLITIVVMMMLFKGVLMSMAGPAPNYDMQRVLATRKPKESALMSGIVSVCLFPRWIMVSGITVLALTFFRPQIQAMGSNIDFEMILPYIVNNFIPTGLLGLLLAGLLAAFMSTFDATVNAGAAYIVNDIYKRYINPKASDRKYVVISYISSIAIVIVGMVFGLMAKSINDVMQWLFAGLYGGYAAPNLLKWYWWRLNGNGFFWGMISGTAAALFFPLAFPVLSPLFSFPFILLISAGASITASLLSNPEDEKILISFYRAVRPWGFWKPIHEKVISQTSSFKKNTAFKRDMVNIAVGIVWQMTLILIPVYLVIRETSALCTSVFVLIATSLFLKRNWYDKLEEN
jgi:SSS family solute:Na+ symporter